MLTQKRFQSAIQIVLDIVAIRLAWWATIHLRILINPLTSMRVTVDQSILWAPPIVLVAILFVVTSFRFRLFRCPEGAGFWTLGSLALGNALALAMITAVVTFFSRSFGETTSRMFVPLVLPVSLPVFFLARYAAVTCSSLLKGPFNQPLRLAVVGDWNKGSQLILQLQDKSAHTFSGLIVPEADLLAASGSSAPVLGTTRQIGELVNRERLDRVILLNSTLTSRDIQHCSQVLDRMGVPVSCALDFAPNPVQMDVSISYGVPLLDLVPIAFTRRQQIVKRVFDVIISLLSLLLLAPMLLAITLLIKFTSPGPVLYKSLRVGKGGRLFTFLKFRSMYVTSDRGAVAAINEKGGHIFKVKNDPRVTPVGRILRRTSLDELPQLINILLGQMSMVGPRPLPAGDLEKNGMSKEYAAWSEGRAQVPPGLTGLWQVSGRSDLPFEEMVRLDLSYIQKWSLALDIQILISTPALVIRGAGAY